MFRPSHLLILSSIYTRINLPHFVARYEASHCFILFSEEFYWNPFTISNTIYNF